MNFSQLEPGEDYQISFGLNIAGTSAIPSEVRVCVGQDTRICAIARLQSNGQYEATLPIIPEISNNDAIVSIEVIINGKILVPYRETINLSTPQATVSNVETSEITQPEQIITPPKIEPVDVKQAMNDIVKNIFAQEEVKPETPAKIETPIKEEKRKIEFTKPKKQDIINTKPLKLNLSEMATDTQPVVHKTVKPVVTEVKISKIPFKLTKTKIVEK